MNKFIKSIVLFSVLILLAISCSKKDDTVTPAVPPCLVKKITTSFGYPGSTAVTTYVDTYDYDSDNKLSKVTSAFSATGSPSSNTVAVYNYTNGILSSITYAGSTSNWTVQNGRVVKITTVAGTTTSTIDINYTSDGKLTNWHFGQVPDVVEMGYTPTFDISGNVSKDETFLKIKSQSGLSSNSDSRTYSGYDSKNNPYSLIAQSMGVSYYFLYNGGGYRLEGYGKNNPGTILDIYKDLVNNQTVTFTYNYTYEYNTKNYVTKSISSATGQVTTTTNFEYTNCN
jgi:hypothetical protein